ncbi:MAG TPA: pyrimidine reductase family protein [Acidimicrobiales bacterium]|nr:pyrimidine reductase family protein [Acidimicrobiales bacterium]
MRTLLPHAGHHAGAAGHDAGAPGGELSDEDIESLYAPPATGRHVRANFVASLDGAVEIKRRSGPLGSDDDHRVFVTLRALSDVVLVGAETARQESYGPAILSGDRRERRRQRDQAPLPPLAVVTGRALLDPASRMFREPEEGDPAGPRPIVITCEAAPEVRRRALSGVAEVVVCGGDAVDMATALDALVARGLRRVLCEGGPTLFTELVAGGLLDELCLTHAPLLAGPVRTGLTAGAPLRAPVSLHLDMLLAGDGALLARYQIDSRPKDKLT